VSSRCPFRSCIALLLYILSIAYMGPYKSLIELLLYFRHRLSTLLIDCRYALFCLLFQVLCDVSHANGPSPEERHYTAWTIVPHVTDIVGSFAARFCRTNFSSYFYRFIPPVTSDNPCTESIEGRCGFRQASRLHMVWCESLSLRSSELPEGPNDAWSRSFSKTKDQSMPVAYWWLV
jgi:hypothetical protein